MIELNEKLFACNVSGKQYIIHQGGTGSGKTWSILQFLLLYTLFHKKKSITIAGQSMPHLKTGIIDVINKIIREWNLEYLFRENKTYHTFTNKLTGSYIEILSASDASKLKGPKRDLLFINECNKISHPAFLQLDMRTTGFIFLDFNPDRRFWVHDKLMPFLDEEHYVFCKSTYRDNPFVVENTVLRLERLKETNPEQYRVYGDGEIGMMQGSIFTNYEVIKITDNTMSGKLLGNGLDWGYTVSPTAVVAVYEFGDDLVVRELYYKTHTQPEQLLKYLEGKIDFKAPAWGDSSNPQTIDKLVALKWRTLKPCRKGPDSIMHGIELMQEKKIFISDDSPNIIREFGEYQWEEDKDGTFINSPRQKNCHAIDAIRYVLNQPKPKDFGFH